MALLIKVDGNVERVSPKGKKFSSGELRRLLDLKPSGYLQMVPMPNGELLWCDEEGIRNELPLNLVATLGYGRFVAGGQLLGNILLTDAKDVD